MNKTERQAVINDPDGHFPYKRAAAIKAGVPEEIAEICERAVKAEQAYLEDPNDETYEARNAANVEAQERSAALKNVRRKAALQRQLAELKEGKQPAHVDFLAPPAQDSAAVQQERIEQQLAALEGRDR